MNRATLIVLIVLLVLVGPAMFVFSRSHALDVALARIRPGDSPAQVVKALGQPQERLIVPLPAAAAPPGAASAARVEYRYTVWPLPGAWRVEFEHDKVIGTARR